MLPRHLLVAALCLLGLGLSSSQLQAQEDAPEPPTIKLVGLKITKPIEGIDKEDDVVQFREPVGTTVTLMVVAGTKKIVSFNEEKSELTAFSDEKGNSLLTKKTGFGTGQGFSWFNKSEKGQVATLDVKGDGTPADGTEKLKLTGTLVLTVASKQASHQQADVKLVKGTKVTAGPMSCEISSAGESEWEENAYEIGLKFKKDVSSLAEVRFLDANGKVIESSLDSTSTMSVFGKTTTTYSYTLKKEVDVATIDFKVWTDAETINLPLNQALGVGL